MKKIYILIFSFGLLFLGACSDYLDIVPDNVATIDHAFTDKVSAERFLATIYSYMPRIGKKEDDPSLFPSDEYGVTENSYMGEAYYGYANSFKSGKQNTNSPLMNYWNGSNGGRGLFIALRDCNIFLENIEKVGPDLTEDERIRWIAEVKFFKAFYHYYLVRLYGPIPLIKENIPISGSVEQVRVYRDTFEDCIQYIVQLCDEAMVDLPLTITNVVAELGRVTKPMAAMLKAEVLATAASPLFNGNPDFAGMVDNRGTKLFGAEDLSKWQTAASACKEAIDLCREAGVDLYKFTDTRYQLSDTTRLCMDIRGTVTDKWNIEMIWGNPLNVSFQGLTIPFFKTTDKQGNGPSPEVYATFRMAELFYSNHGVPIEEDVTYQYSDRYKTTIVGKDHYYYIPEGKETAILNTYREPRFYANLGFDCGYWYGNGRTKDVGMGNTSETPWIIAAKAGEMSGKEGDIRYSKSGYFIKKVSNFETATNTNGALVSTRYTWPIMRLADLYLLYAETLNESLESPTSEVYEYVDLVRRRAGLKGVVESWSNYSKIPNKPQTKNGMRDIIRQERLIELCFEGKRFWDLRRWKMAHEYFNQPERGWNVSQKETKDYYNVVIVQQQAFTTKQYLWPISENELRKNANLIQNPYWE